CLSWVVSGRWRGVMAHATDRGLAHDALVAGASSATTCSTLRLSTSQMARMLSSPIGARLAPNALVRVRGAMPVSLASSRRLLPASAIAALTIDPLTRGIGQFDPRMIRLSSPRFLLARLVTVTYSVPMGTHTRIEDIARQYQAEVLADIADGIVPPAVATI